MNFELSWRGGQSARRFRRARPMPEFDWDTLSPAPYDPLLVERARASWTYGAYLEHATALQFAAMTETLLELRAPLDLVGVTAGFVSDELLHAELNARIAMCLGGGAPLEVETRLPELPGSARMRLAALAVHTCLVGEAFSVPLLAATAAGSAHPLVHAVLTRIVRDEAPHARVGEWILDWLEPFTDAEKQVLGATAARALSDALRGLDRLPPDPTGPRAQAVSELGWLPATSWREVALRCVEGRIRPALARRGFSLDA